MEATFSVGIDLGGSHVSAVVMELSTGAVQSKACRDISVEDRASVESIIDRISECIFQVVEEASASEKWEICLGRNIPELSIGIGVPGNVNPASGTTRYLPNFGWHQEVPLRELIHKSLLHKALPCTFKPLQMRNDGRCAALAEAEYGSGKYASVFAMLTLGTGIGGALIVNGVLFDGVSFDCGDFGHHVISSGEAAFPCICGKSGCFERHASAQGLVRHYERTSSGKASDAEEVIQKMRDGDMHAQAAFVNFMDDLSTGLANLVSFYNPSVIALGGGLSQCIEIFENIELLVNQKTLPATRGIVSIVPSMLGPDAGAIGAALLYKLEV